jgi:hypothetical protein
VLVFISHNHVKTSDILISNLGQPTGGGPQVGGCAVASNSA